ncbi:hypothetical protein GB931_04415 [Modestobacter sp. I12A-02628]|uniref:Uncharacterized protein n=1 Tax=Goekera deserti TaxID=2497753 RepID=A0A7K3WE01_9ACTN|nr:hypothetical protein [Goekera deserti]MPQ97182.1 hypothetical protein [Goekera deserti]NDI46500.1 hypothetical protein [Goekera deserti]NEL54566.1 hypothetical protein [Goekera deserti]
MSTRATVGGWRAAVAAVALVASPVALAACGSGDSSTQLPADDEQAPDEQEQNEDENENQQNENEPDENEPDEDEPDENEPDES